MTNSRTFSASGLAVSAVMLSPLIVIFLIPLTIGVGLHIFELLGEGPFALVLCVPLAFALLRPFPTSALEPPRGAPTPRLHSIGRGELNDAVSSIS
jgi:hypothetical protein